MRKTPTPVNQKLRAFTEEEIRENFLKHAREFARYWAFNVPAHYSPLERTEGAIFSLLAMMDGSNVGIPGFKVIPNPHPDDKKFYIEHGENWYPDDIDIGGCLHELFHKRDV